MPSPSEGLSFSFSFLGCSLFVLPLKEHTSVHVQKMKKKLVSASVHSRNTSEDWVTPWPFSLWLLSILNVDQNSCFSYSLNGAKGIITDLDALTGKIQCFFTLRHRINDFKLKKYIKIECKT